MGENLNAAAESLRNPAPGRKVYRIALTMSGAISAGAYTAGVFDFLIQALTELELAKSRQGDGDLPDHDVRIVAMTGASAGGVTAALGTVALGYGMRTEPAPPGAAPTLMMQRMKNDAKSPIDCVLPRLYNAWVIQPRMFGPTEDDPALLSVHDIKKGAVNSLLNWQVLDGIRNAALKRPDPLGSGVPYAFFAEPLHVYLAISNLRGVPYDVKGANDSAAYHMLSHGDRLHFKVDGLGQDASVASDWGSVDQGIATSVDDLRAPAPLPDAWQVLGDAALATAAFPGGLSARLLKATRDDFKDRWFPAPEFVGTDIAPSWPDGFAVAPTKFGFVNVDGGMINNDPFEYARYALLDNWRHPDAQNPRRPDEADRAVIMIAPFPEGERFNTEDRLDIGLLNVAKSLLPTLISQARFKLTELAAATDANTASRWLIAPRRSGDPEETPSSDNLACGLLGGFGGFFDQGFREHESLLGRRNCQKFLQGLRASAFTAASGKPVIPLFGTAKPEVPQPDWPRMSRENFETLMARIALRAGAVVPALIKQEAGSWLLRWVANVAWVGGGRGKLLSIVRGSILSDLLLRDQIEDGLPAGTPSNDARLLRNFNPDERKVIAAMADGRYDLRTAPGIAASTKLPVDFVARTIERALKLPVELVHCVWKAPIQTSDGHATFALYSRRLTARAWPLIGPVLRRVDNVSIDWPPPTAP